MRVAAIIAEYNPFHKGHRYLIKKTREVTGADYIIAVMSGDFTQRGTPAIADKYLRAQMALQNGVDLVVELPVHYACSSAEYFARGAVTLLEKLGVTDLLCFGSESGEIDKLHTIAKILAEEPEEYREHLKTYMKRGYNYPMARNQALEMVIPDFVEYEDIIQTPNNILGIEYLKALIQSGSQITPYTVRRMGSGYHDHRLNVAYSSAISIRHSLLLGNSIARIVDQVPKNCHPLLFEHANKSFPIFPDDFSTILKYRLLLEADEGFTGYADVSQELSDKIKKHLFKMDKMEDFCDLLKTKELTHARISRSLGHILLNIRQEEMDELKANGTVHYARVLGFREESDKLLKKIKKNTSIPLITKPADAAKLLDPNGLAQFEKDIEVSHIYEMIAASKFGHPIRNEYKRQVIKL
ncbi:MAG: nucleotidyltransferase [Lachnospiraceae bacterium]|nr:nucleotidyltransferase [Lachnospiraceae bacterium]